MRKLAFLILVCLTPVFLSAQNTGVGVKPFGSYTQGGFDTINNQDLNVMFSIPIVSSAGRGQPLNFALTYNSQIYQISGGVLYHAKNWGWQWDTPPGGTAGNTPNSAQVRCFLTGYPMWTTTTMYTNYYFIDALGTLHAFPISRTYQQCGAIWSGTNSGYASDASGYYMTTGGGANPTVTGPGGQQLGNSSTAEDVNGNFVSRATVTCTGTPPCVEADWTDSVGNIALKIIYTPSDTSPTQIQYEFQDLTGHYQTITLKLQILSVSTNFACGSVSELMANATVPKELDIPSPNGGSTVLKYSFGYEQTTSGYSGRLTTITLPTGGSYEYDYPGANDGINCSDGTALTMNRTVTESGTNSAVWNFVRNTTNKTTTVTTPQLPDTPNASNTVYTFNSTGQEVTQQIYADTGTTLLRTTNTAWAANSTPSSSITILEDGTTKAETDTSYDLNGLLDSVTEYDWGPGTHGSSMPIRTTTYSYQTSSVYTNRNIINLVTSKQIKDGTGAVQYRQDIAYDGAALSCPTGALQHDETGYPCTMGTRGNPTAITTYLAPATPTGGVTKNFTYDWFGNRLTAQLSCCNTKSWTYSSTYQYSQPTTVQSGNSPSLTVTNTYNQFTGLVTSSVDPNGLESDYDYDFLRRPISVKQKNGAITGQSISYTYVDATPFSSTVKTTIDSSNSVQQISSIDGLGRTLTMTLENGSNTIFSIVANNYDLTGRAYKVSNPYTTGSPSNWTTTNFDALGRPTSVVLQDGSQTTYLYATNTTTGSDPANKLREATYDAAGRLTIATEPDVTNGNSLTLTTTYTYTVLDALQSVTTPDQTRTYNYDKLGQLLSTVTPEGGTTCFGSKSGSTCNPDGYDSIDNMLIKRTDARGVLTSYTYDGLNRLTGESYNVGTTGVPATSSISLTYGLDSSCVSAHGAGCIGQVITMTDGVGSENYTYNSLEQMTKLQKVIGSTTYTTNYQYNFAGQITQITYPSGRVVQQSFDSIGRICEIAPSTTGCGTSASPYATGYIYNAANQVNQFKYGNGLYGSFGYSTDRLQLSCLDYSNQNRSGTCTHDTNTRFGLDYTYGSAAANNGQITKISDYVNSGRTTAYTYDGLARLSAAHTSGSTTYPAWSLTWGYDRYGNRLNQTLVSGPGYPGSAIVNKLTNQITCINGTIPNCSGGVVPTYDANGNMTFEGTNTIIYDAENRAVSATNQSASGSYTYDGNGLRVKRVSGSTSTVYVFSGSKVMAEYDNGAAVGSPSREYVYSGGTLLAKFDSTGTNYYQHDHLSTRYVSNASGTLVEQMGHYPFGDPWYNANNDKLFFTTYERDSESSNDYAQARFYRWLVGRFLSPDPLSGSIENPQSLNRYPYVGNDPTNATDPSGQMKCENACPNWNGSGGGGGDGYYGDNGGNSEGQVTYIFLGPVVGYLPGTVNGDPTDRAGEYGYIYAFSPYSGAGGSGSSQSFGGGLQVKIPPPPPPPGYKECIMAALREMIAHDEGTSAQPNNGYGALVHGTVKSSPVPFEDLTGEAYGIHGFAPYNLPNPSALQGHPNILVSVNGLGILSTAFGRYQIIAPTAKTLGPGGTPWTDWSPSGQDAAANILMAQKGMIDDAMSGQIVQAIYDGNTTWASLPDAPSNQHPKGWQETIGAFQDALMSLPECQ
jgi:RHS repeat-associated protein